MREHDRFELLDRRSQKQINYDWNRCISVYAGSDMQPPSDAALLLAPAAMTAVQPPAALLSLPAADSAYLAVDVASLLTQPSVSLPPNGLPVSSVINAGQENVTVQLDGSSAACLTLPTGLVAPNISASSAAVYALQASHTHALRALFASPPRLMADPSGVPFMRFDRSQYSQLTLAGRVAMSFQPRACAEGPRQLWPGGPGATLVLALRLREAAVSLPSAEESILHLSSSGAYGAPDVLLSR